MSDILQLAAEALADAAKAPAAPWVPDIDDANSDDPDFTGKFYVGDGERSVCLYNDSPEQLAMVHWIAAARSREPQLAEACIAMAKEVERLRKIEKDRNYALQVQNEQLEAVVADRDELREMKGVNAWADAIRLRCNLECIEPRADEIDSVMSLLTWMREKHDRDSSARQWLERVVAFITRPNAALGEDDPDGAALRQVGGAK